ncbi:MFS transporter [Piscinibacter terrae]|uniref:MFS transporter n=1 Tax=Piscinibacter terrae TaxID=2496871 RepID=A0A3N7HI92_9BURK|nr:MFS transporter [Albitalea terrae]RQP21750.1 MFS transporter [Albitalea terrae]
MASMSRLPSEPSRREFVAIVAAIMAVNALAIDTMLAALPSIGDTFHVRPVTRLTWIVTAYVLGYGVALPVFGTLADQFGRRRLLLGGLAVYAVCAALAASAGSLSELVALRVLQGMGGACSVMALAIVRDRYSGAEMSRIVSLSFATFIVVPVLAPGLGQLMLSGLSWRWIFGFIAACGGLTLAWVACRLPESLPVQRRLPFSARGFASTLHALGSDRAFVSYTLATTAMLGALFGLINSCQPLLAQVFHAPHLFPLVFGGMAASVAASALVNQRVTSRIGVRRAARRALLAYLVLASVHAAVAWLGFENLAWFIGLQAPLMFCFGLAVSNFGTAAMESVGRIAGTAASVQGAITNVGGGLIGVVIGQQFDSKAMALTVGTLLCACTAWSAAWCAKPARRHPDNSRLLR